MQDDFSSLEIRVVDLTFGDVEATLAAMHRIRPEKRIAFRARLKHLQREGWPEGANTGTGKRFSYTLTALMQMALALELLQAGLSPRRSVTILKHDWEETAVSLMCARAAIRLLSEWGKVGTADLEEIFWCVHPEALQDLSAPRRGEENDRPVMILRPGQLAPHLTDATEVAGIGGHNRALVIGLRALTIELDLKLAATLPNLDVEELLPLYCAELARQSFTSKNHSLIVSFANFLQARK